VATQSYSTLNDYVHSVQSMIGATAAVVCIIQDHRMVNEWYSGRHDFDPSSRRVDERSQFNVASIRKTYLGIAVSLLLELGLIGSVDDRIGDYLEECAYVSYGVTLRHLLTHTHGLYEDNGRILRAFPAGTGWAYNNTGVGMLVELVIRLTGRTLSEFMQQNVFEPYRLAATGWRTEYRDELIYNYDKDGANWVGPNTSARGDQSNLFVNARELAQWGYLHLTKGYLNGEQPVPRTVFERVTASLTPASVPSHEPKNGYFWWLQSDVPLNQLGNRLPDSSFQVLGITGCACLVIPACNAVVVRMYNQLRPMPGYDYLSDIRTFGNLAYELLVPNQPC